MADQIDTNAAATITPQQVLETLERAHRMSVSDHTDPTRTTLYSQGARVIRDLLAELAPAPCEMTHTPPYDFAQCERHDTTFPLGGACKFHERDPFEVLYAEVDQQRGRAVRAEMDRDHLAAQLLAEHAHCVTCVTCSTCLTGKESRPVDEGEYVCDPQCPPLEEGPF